jgi:hypothetical protein
LLFGHKSTEGYWSVNKGDCSFPISVVSLSSPFETLTHDRSEAAMTFTTLILAQVLTSFAPAIIGLLVAAGSATAASINQSRLGLASVSPFSSFVYRTSSNGGMGRTLAHDRRPMTKAPSPRVAEHSIRASPSPEPAQHSAEARDEATA